MPVPVIAQTQAVHRYSTLPLPNFTGTGATGTNNWTADNGVFTPAATANTVASVYTPANQTRLIGVHDRDSSDNATQNAVIRVQATFPFQPDWKDSGRTMSDKKNMSLSEDRSPDFLRKGPLQRVWRYAVANADLAEWQIFDAFYSWHQTTEWFWYADQPRDGAGPGVLYKVRFDSEFPDQPVGADWISYSYVLRQATDDPD